MINSNGQEGTTHKVHACMHVLYCQDATYYSDHAQLKQNAMVIYTGYRKVCVVMINGPSNQVRKRGIATCTVEVIEKQIREEHAGRELLIVMVGRQYTLAVQ